MNKLLNYQIIITGVTGWLGSRLRDRLCAMGLQYGADILGISSRSPCTFDNIESYCDDRPKIIFHFAFITKDKVNSLSEQDYIQKNHALRDAVAQLISKYKTNTLVYASSGAVYKYLEKTDKPDLYLYGKLKFDDEIFFDQITRKHHIQYIQPRIFNLSGANINKVEHYALANFIQTAIEQKSIVIRAAHHVIRSYIDIDMFLDLLLALITQSKETSILFDASGNTAIELHDLAKAIVKTLPLPPVAIEVSATRTGQDSYLGSSKHMSQLLQRFNIFPISMDQQIINTYRSLTGANHD